MKTNEFGQFFKKNGSIILMIVGCVGLIGNTILSSKATLNAYKRLKQKKQDLNKEVLTKKEVIKYAWKDYIPVILLGAASTACLISSTIISKKKEIALSSAYVLAETTLRTFKDKVVTSEGEEKTNKIIEDVKKSVKTSKKSDNDKINYELANSDSEILFLETWSGRYLKMSWNNILEKCNSINQNALMSNISSYTVNEWYDLLGLDPTEGGDEVGWGTPTYDTKGLMKIHMESFVTKNHIPCGKICYDVKPYKI